jgi:hypothetical protein
MERTDISAMLSQLIESLIYYAPKFVSAGIVLLIGWVAGRILARIVYGIVTRVGLGAMLRKTSIGKAVVSSGYTIPQLFSTLTKWFIYLVALYGAIDILAIPILIDLMKWFLAYLPHFISGVLVLIVGFIFADWIGDLIKHMGAGVRAEYYNFMGNAVRVFLYFIVITMALAQMKIDVTIIYLFAQAFAWAIAICLSVGIGVAFGWQLKDRVGPWLDRIIGKPEEKKSDVR